MPKLYGPVQSQRYVIVEEYKKDTLLKGLRLVMSLPSASFRILRFYWTGFRFLSRACGVESRNHPTLSTWIRSKQLFLIETDWYIELFTCQISGCLGTLPLQKVLRIADFSGPLKLSADARNLFKLMRCPSLPDRCFQSDGSKVIQSCGHRLNASPITKNQSCCCSTVKWAQNIASFGREVVQMCLIKTWITPTPDSSCGYRWPCC